MKRLILKDNNLYITYNKAFGMAATISSTELKNNERLNNGMGELHNNNKKSLNIEQFLKGFKVNRDELFTHTSWGNMKGKYYVPPTATERFLEIYKFNVENGLDMCITEKHRDVSPVLIDLDFRQETAERLYTQDDVVVFIDKFNTILQKYVDVGEGNQKYYVLEKPSPRVNKSGGFKDGLHIVCPEIITRPLIQHIIRKEMLDTWEKLTFNTGITNKKDDIFDEAVIEKNNWFLYGSKKPDEEFGWKASFTVACEVDTGHCTKMDIAEVKESVAELVDLFSIRNKFVESPNREDMKDVIQKFKEDCMIKNTPQLSTVVNQTWTKNPDWINMATALTSMLSTERANDYNTWIQVGWCLNNIDNTLLKEWIKFSKKSTKYIEGECERLWHFMKRGDNCLGMGTLHRWAKTDDLVKYSELVQEDIRMLINNAKSGTEYDVAMVVKKMYGDNHVYANESKTWYVFREHRWEKDDEGMDLKIKLPTEIVDAFRTTSAFFQARAARPDTLPDDKERLDDIVKKFQEVISKLKRAAFQSSVMTECAMLFFVKKFEENLDEKHNLIGFENGVYDLDTDEFRHGRPEDMITLSTGYCYTSVENTNYREKIMDFLLSIQDSQDMIDYLLMILAMSLHGTKHHELMFFWVGKGGNGKGLLAMLYNKSMGKYAHTIPMQLYTTKKKSSSEANSEVAKGKGKRAWNSCEPEEDDILYTSFLKLITGGDPIPARDLYGKAFEFKPQATPFLQMNKKPIMAGCGQDVRRRLRIINFPFNFVAKPNPLMENEKLMDTEIKNLFQDDVNYHQQFMLMLLEIYKEYRESGFVVNTPESVVDATEEYLDENNFVKNFICENYDIDRKNTEYVALSNDVYTAFTSWGKTNGAPKINQGSFKEQLNALGFKTGKYTQRGKINGVSYKDRMVVYGIRSQNDMVDVDDDYN